MDIYTEVFNAAEDARILGDYARAVELYAEANSLAKEFPSVDRVALHHMWGVALINLRRTEEARVHLRKALAQTSSEKLRAAINRDYSRSYLIDGRLATATHYIEVSLNSTPASDLAERGASIGFKARILLAAGKIDKALELFGTADVLLQRSENRHYELYNLIHFLEALIEHRLPFFDDNWADVDFAEEQVPRLRERVSGYGGPSHKERVANIIADIFAEREG